MRPLAAVTVLLMPMLASANELTERAITAETTIQAPRSAVWTALTQADQVGHWFGYAAKVELRPGGPYEIFFLRDEAPGRRGGEGNAVQSYRPGHLLALTWNAPPMFGALRDVRTFVLIELTDVGADTHVKLTHYGFRTGPEWEKVADYFTPAWPRVLAGLKAHSEKSR